MMNAYNFSERVRRVLGTATEEAARFNHEYIGTEHILLALIREGEGVGITVLRRLNIEPDKIREELEGFLRKGNPATKPTRELPYTTRAKKVLEIAIHQARELGHEYIGTGDLLLGLILEGKGIAGQVLTHRGVTYDNARDEVLRLAKATVPVPRKTVEIRSINLKPGTRAEFHRTMLEESVPLQERRGTDVVSFGLSRHDENSYYVIRAYDSFELLTKSQDDFYGSDEWRNGPRERLLAAIENYTTIVLEMNEAALNALRTL